MIKMTIAGEEVVSNKEFTITEEMLATSSTILNNCYPKTWEQDHDYISRFYYPKDYSKCLINQITEIPAEVGEYATGSNLNINADDSKEWSYQLDGNIIQSGTPTPSNPIEIQKVIGDQVVNIIGKNLFNFNGAYYSRYTTTSISTQDSTITITNNNANNAGYLWWNIDANIGNNYIISYDNLAENPVKTNNTMFYALSDSKITTYSNLSSNGFTLINKTNKYATFNATKKYIIVGLRVAPSTSYSINDIQLEVGLTPTYYDNYQVQTFLINLPISNLFDKSSATYKNNYYIDTEGVETSSSKSGYTTSYIQVSPNTTYTISGSIRTSATTTGMYYYDSSKNWISKEVWEGSSNVNSLTFTTPSNCHYIQFQYTKSVFDADTVQICEGTTTTYWDYGTTQIELCKIGDYQDYIYKDGDNWYKYSAVGKIVLNGSETGWNFVSGSIWKFRVSVSDLISNSTGSTQYWFYSNYYKAEAGDNYGIGQVNNTTRIGFKNTDFQTLDDFKTWLSTHNTTVYYPLATPTTTQITDTTLVSQLEALAGATLYNGTNNIVVSGSIPIVLNLHYNFVTGQAINNLLFSGLVKNSGNISLRPTEPKYCSLQILDFKTLLSEGETLDFVISNKTVLEAIQMVVDAVSQYGFVLGNVNIIGGNDIIGAYSTQEKSAYDVFQYLADITQSRWSTRMVDENTVAIDFYDPTLMPQGIDIDYTKEWFKNNQVKGLSFNYGTRDYRNKQVMLSDQVYGGTDYIDTILGDGYNKSFLTTANIGLIKSITVNGTSVTFATNEDKELGIDADFYYTPGNDSISTDNSYSAGTQIVVTYTPLIKGREVIYNTDEVQRINSQIGRKGVIARYEQRNDILTSDNLEKVGQAYIKYKGSAEIILTLSTRVDIYNIGELVHFNAPITELDTDYMVKKKSTQIIATGDYSNVFYTYELTSSFNSESAINYFDNQRNKTYGNISQGEYITRNIDIENTANIIWDNLTITEVTPNGDNVLNSILNSPFTQ